MDKLQHNNDSLLESEQESVRAKGSEKSVIIYVLVLLLATLTTWALGLINIDSEKTIPIGFEQGFPGNVDSWGRKGDWEAMAFSDDAIFIQRKNEQQSAAFRTFELPDFDNIDQYRLQVEGIVENQTIELNTQITPLENPMGALMVWIHGSDEEIIQYRTIQDLDPAVSHHEAKRSVSLPENAEAVSITMATRGSVAGYLLLNASMQLVKENSAGSYIKIFLGIMWAILLLIALIWIVKRTTVFFALSVFITCLIIGVGIVLPDSISSRLILPIQLKLSNYTSGFDQNLMEPLFKSGHFFFFLIVALVLFLKRHALGISAVLLFVLLLLVAIATEGVQLQLYDRTTRFTDFIIDLSGIAVGASFATLFRLWKPESITTIPPTKTD